MMKRVIVHLAMLATIGLLLSPFGISDAAASDIICQPRAGESTVRCEDPNGSGMRCWLSTDSGARASQRPHHLICESGGLPERYERIYAEQQRMLRKGSIRESDIANWRARRDACVSARCLDSLFHLFWRDPNSMRSTPAHASTPQAAANATAMPPPVTAPVTTLPATQDSASPPAPVPHTRDETVVDRVPPATNVAPVQVGFAPVAARAVETSHAVQFEDTPTSTDSAADPHALSPAPIALQSLAAGLVVIGTGLAILWHRRARETYQAHPGIPAAMVIAYALLLVNVLLLPFTLGLK